MNSKNWRSSTLEEEKDLAKAMFDAMVKKLEANRDRGHWMTCTDRYLFGQADRKLRLLKSAVKNGDWLSVQGLAADVSNFIQMVVENRTS